MGSLDRWCYRGIITRHAPGTASAAGRAEEACSDDSQPFGELLAGEVSTDPPRVATWPAPPRPSASAARRTALVGPGKSELPLARPDTDAIPGDELALQDFLRERILDLLLDG